VVRALCVLLENIGQLEELLTVAVGKGEIDDNGVGYRGAWVRSWVAAMIVSVEE
jgi:hypothetical protein